MTQSRGSQMTDKMASEASENCVPVLEVPQAGKQRYERLCKQFETIYGCSPSFYARAPGRVNLIGEHIDYCGYDVLPMAIDQDIVIACAVTEDASIQLANSDPEHRFNTALGEVTIDRQAPKWFHYFLCGYKGALEDAGLSSSVGLQLLVDGTVPRSAGLSSSSAFVCCSCLVTLHANKKSLDKHHLAEVCQHCERYIGTEGGGMDQAISFLAESGTAKLIEFNPLKTSDVILPEKAAFVVSHSGVEMNKAATSHFNTRVAECRLAMQVLAKSQGLSTKDLKNLRELQSKLDMDIDQMVALVKSVLHKEQYTRAELCEKLEISDQQLESLNLSEHTKHLKVFNLHDRALHVYSEAARVWQFKQVCDDRSSDAMHRLGELMNQSHASCSDLYDCSCPELDSLVDQCRSSGALGSRLTGAGWGGCVISLVPDTKVEQFLTSVKDGFYSTGSQTLTQSSQSTSSCLFATQPGGGAAIYTN